MDVAPRPLGGHAGKQGAEREREREREGDEGGAAGKSACAGRRRRRAGTGAGATLRGRRCRSGRQKEAAARYSLGVVEGRRNAGHVGDVCGDDSGGGRGSGGGRCGGAGRQRFRLRLRSWESRKERGRGAEGRGSESRRARIAASLTLDDLSLAGGLGIAGARDHRGAAGGGLDAEGGGTFREEGHFCERVERKRKRISCFVCVACWGRRMCIGKTGLVKSKLGS